MKRIAVIFIIFVFTCSFLVGCQPTPEKPVVVNKNDGKLEEKIESSDEEAAEVIPIEIPETWSEQFDVAENVTITIDAAIEGGDLAAYPVAEVRAVELTDEQINRFIDYFAAGKKLFANEETKADVMLMLIEAKQGTEVDGELIPPQPDDPYIKGLEEKLASMPDDHRTYIEPILARLEGGGLALHAGVELGEGEDAAISVTKIGKYGSASSLSFSRGNIMGETVAGYNNITLKTPSVSKEEAIQSAKQTVAGLGFTDMALATIGVGEMNPTGFGGIHSEYSSSGYLMTFTREVNGMVMADVTDGEGGISYTQGQRGYREPEYRAPWTPEFILIYADENGVQHFSYTNRAETIEVLSENVQLLPLEEIGERAMKQLYYREALRYEETDRVEVTVNRVVLGGTLICKKNDPDTGIMVPAWHFFYGEEYYDDDLKDGYYKSDQNEMIVINAIDGSVIEPTFMPIPEDEQTDDEKLRYSN